MGRTRGSAKQLARRLGLDVSLYRPRNSLAARRAQLLSAQGVELVLDAGANVGQYGQELRMSGYAGRIVSFEPLAKPFAELQRSASRAPPWECRRIALGETIARRTMNVAANYSSSSLLPMSARHLANAPESVCIGTEEVEVHTLDQLRSRLVEPGQRIFFKLDVQGHELAALRGAEITLEAVDLLEVELSLVPLYAGQPLFREVIDYLDARGFRVFSLDPTFLDRDSGRTLQLDALFIREETP